MIIVTGGAGFIGSNFVLDCIANLGTPIVNLDKLTYAGNLNHLAILKNDVRHIFVQGDIGDRALISRLLHDYQPRAIVNFAAESHVDRSIYGPENFIQTNVVATFNLLEEVRAYWAALEQDQKLDFRFLHVSTDEVYGSLGPHDPPFTEDTPYAPSRDEFGMTDVNLYRAGIAGCSGDGAWPGLIRERTNLCWRHRSLFTQVRLRDYSPFQAPNTARQPFALCIRY